MEPNLKINSEKTVKQVLQEARDLIEKGWTQHSFARDENGDEVEVFSDKAVCFCSLGALRRTSETAHQNIQAKTLLWDKVKVVSGYMGIASYNDYFLTDKKDVLKVFDEAIKSCEE